MKKCSCCKIEKSLSEFHKNKSCKDGILGQCKTCVCKKQKDYSEKNKDKIQKRKKKYNESEHGKSKNKEQRRQYYLDNKNIENERSKKWNNDNKEKIKEYKRINEIEWRKNNPHEASWRRILHSSLKRLGKKKEGHTINLLGYSAVELKNHLESLFTPGMSWENRGEWHIDHIKPVSNFDENSPINIINALSNLQPLWATTREINGIIYEGNLNKSNN